MYINPNLIDRKFEKDAKKLPGFKGRLDEEVTKDEMAKGLVASSFKSTWKWARSDWKERSEELRRNKIELSRFRTNNRFNQSPESSCVHNAACVCIMVRRNVQLGTQWHIEVSPMSGYIRVTRRRHSGSMMWGALQLYKEMGPLPVNKGINLKLFKHVFHENTPFVQREELPAGYEATAKHFCVKEWVAVNSREEFISALENQWPVCYGRSGHSIAALELVYSDRGQPLVKYLDSYGHGRGDDGYLYDSERNWATGGAWACKEVSIPDVLCCPAGQDGCDLDTIELAKLWKVDERIIQNMCMAL